MDLRIMPRYTIYDSNEASGQFVIDMTTSYISGEPIAAPWKDDLARSEYTSWTFEIVTEDTDRQLASGKLFLETKAKLLRFSLNRLEPRMQPYVVRLSVQVSTEIGSNQTHSTSTELYYLPAKNSGSTVKIDNLYGGMLVANHATQYAFQSLLPFGFYTSCSEFLNGNSSNVSAYKELGFNAISPVCAYTAGETDALFDSLDYANLWYQYDMRHAYFNLSSVEEQIALMKDRSNLLTWYTTDGPDAQQYNSSSFRLANDLLKKADPYHPTALALKCDNYYFEDYSSGADYIIEDVNPIGNNSTLGRNSHTVVNATHEDSGCDDCEGVLKDFSSRLVMYSTHLEWLRDQSKPLWTALQAFSGDIFWSREPTSSELWAMIVLSFNHRAKGIMSRLSSSSDASCGAYGSIAKAVTVPEVSRFLLGAQPTKINVTGQPLLDVAFWKIGGHALVAMANLNQNRTSDPVTIHLPFRSTKVTGQPWGSLSWSLSTDNNLSTYGLDGLATSILILNT